MHSFLCVYMSLVFCAPRLCLYELSGLHANLMSSDKCLFMKQGVKNGLIIQCITPEIAAQSIRCHSQNKQRPTVLPCHKMIFCVPWFYNIIFGVPSLIVL